MVYLGLRFNPWGCSCMHAFSQINQMTLRRMKAQLPTRLLILGSSAAFLVLGLMGVSGSRDIAARYGNIQIPVAWYLFPIVLAVLVAVSALLLPAAVLRWRRGVVVWVLILVTLLLGSTSPLLYGIYDFEHHLSSRTSTGTAKP